MPADFSKRPPKILVHPASEHASGFYRMSSPAMAMRANGVATTLVERGFRSAQDIAALNPDVIVVQHPYTKTELDALRAYRNACPNAHIVYEIDDKLWDVPESNGRGHLIPAGIRSHLRRGMQLCDAVVTTTRTLAGRLRTEIKCRDPVVVPNFLTQRFFNECAAGRSDNRRKPPHAKPRVGWAGGTSHAAELNALADLIRATADRVQWVFMGSSPVGVEGLVEIHAAVGYDAYPRALTDLDLDLAIAPFGHTDFDNCKSDLRVLEFAAAGFPVLSNACYGLSVIGMQFDQDPAIAAERLVRFLPGGADADYCAAQGALLHEWAKSERTLEKHLDTWLRAWLPIGAALFSPHEAADPTGVFARLSGTASISSASNDGDYPMVGRFTPITPEQADDIKLAAGPLDLWPAAIPHGPNATLSRAALARVGEPDFKRYADRNVALMEWGARCLEIGLKHVVDPGAFTRVAEPPKIDDDTIRQMREVMQWHPRLADAMNAVAEDKPYAEARAELDFAFSRITYEAPPTESYAQWHEMHYGRGSLRHQAQDAAVKTLGDKAPKPVWSHGISWVLADDVEESWVVLYTDGSLDMAQMATMQLAISENPDAALLYADHDHIGKDGQALHPFFKPDFNYELLLAIDYITPVCAFRRDLLAQVYVEGESLFATLLRYIEAHAWLNGAPDASKIVHVPQVLAHLPLHLEDPAARQGAVVEHLLRTGQPAAVGRHPAYAPALQVRFLPSTDLRVRVAVIATDRTRTARCLRSMSANRSALPYDLRLVGDVWVRELADGEPTVADLDSAVADREYDVLVVIEDCVEVLDGAMIGDMAALAARQGVGMVGVKMLAADHKTVAHGGVLLGTEPTVYVFEGMPVENPGINGRAVLTAEWSAVSSACYAIRREVLESVAADGPHIDWCESLGSAGLRNIVCATTPAVLHGRPDGEAADLSGFATDPQVNANVRPTAFLTQPALLPPPLPWLSEDDQQQIASPQRVLLVNGDLDTARKLFSEGYLCFLATVTGGEIVIDGPQMPNVKPFDIAGDAPRLLDALRGLDIQTITLADAAGVSVAGLVALLALERASEGAITVAWPEAPGGEQNVANVVRSAVLKHLTEPA